MINDKLKKLYEERKKLDTDQKALLEKAEKENRGLNAEEEDSYQKMEARFNAVADEIKAEEKALKDLETRLLTHKDRAGMFTHRDDDLLPDPEEEKRRKQAEIERRKDPIRNGIALWRAHAEYGDAFRSFLMGDIDKRQMMDRVPVEIRRTLQADKDVVGGFLVVPETFMADLVQDLKNAVFVRSLGRNIAMPKADTIAWPVLDETIDDSNWTSELKTGSEDTGMDFEKITLQPKPSAKRVKISETLIRKAAIDIEALVRTELGYKFGVTEEKAFMTGNGGGKPIGLFHAVSAGGLGISTARDVSTGNTTTEIKADNLIECKYTLKAQWRKNCVWIFHRDAIKQIRKLKTGDGQYLWKAGISTDRPDTILDYPVYESEYAPNTFTTGLYVGLLGDLNYYLIVTALDMRVATLTELYAETNEIGYIGRMETDAAPIRENAFVRVKLA